MVIGGYMKEKIKGIKDWIKGLFVGEVNDNKISKYIGFAICGVQLVVGIIFIWSIVELNILPVRYFALLMLILLAVSAGGFLAQFKSKKHAITAKILVGAMAVVLIIGTVHSYTAIKAFNAISSIDIQLDNMVVVVRNDDEAEDIFAAADYVYGVQGTIDTEELDGLNGYVATMVEEIEVAIEDTIEVIEYETLNDQIEALENGAVDAIIYNDAYTVIIEDENEDFSDTVKVIFEYGIEVEKVVDEDLANIETSSQVFSVYISGIDTYGSISNTSRSDVNIIAVINPTTEQILLVSTPRDYYVELEGLSGDSEDKLTHAGVYGVDVSVATLEELYDMDIDFYARVNFTSLIKMIDALGGITVYSQQSFWTTEDDGVTYYISEGYNDLSGIETLYFARERYKLWNGDYQRGENHEEIIKAMIEKATSPAIITGAYEILESVADNLDTSMSMSQIQELIKMQIDEDIDWEIIMVSAEGTDGSAMCYSYAGGELSVVFPDEDSVAEISDMSEAIIAGEILEVETEETEE